ncbi:MAG: KH domain-containing protein [Lachnospiraceae bacterium]|nr:KH domain-containing protein [Lachnospiraceae bacterium]
MKELVEVIARALVDDPDKVVVTEEETDKDINVTLRVAKDDMGKVIGRSGRIAKAIRAVVKAAATKTDKHVNVDILDEDEG